MGVTMLFHGLLEKTRQGHFHSCWDYFSSAAIRFLPFISLLHERPKEGDKSVKMKPIFAAAWITHMGKNRLQGKVESLPGCHWADLHLLSVTDPDKPPQEPLLPPPLAKCVVKHRCLPHIILLLWVFSSPQGKTLPESEKS